MRFLGLVEDILVNRARWLDPQGAGAGALALPRLRAVLRTTEPTVTDAVAARGLCLFLADCSAVTSAPRRESSLRSACSVS